MTLTQFSLILTVIGILVPVNAMSVDIACSADSITQSCSIFKKTGMILKTFPDGTILPNFLHWAIDAPSHQSELLKRYTRTDFIFVDRGKEIFNELKAVIIQNILKEREESQLTLAEQNLLIRIRHTFLKLKPQENCNSFSKVMDSPEFDRFTHNVLVCPGFLNFSRLTVAFALGHEFGHVFAPCNMSLGLYHTDDKQFTSMPLSQAAEDFIDKIKSHQLTRDIPGESLMSNPYRPVRECLLQKYPSILSAEKKEFEKIEGITRPTSSMELELILDSFEQIYSGKYQTPKDNNNANLSHMKELAKNSIDCSKGLEEINETFADIFGNRILNLYIEQKKLNIDKGPLDKLAVIGTLAAGYCLGARGLPDPTGHHKENLRIAEILSSPDLAAKFGCIPSKNVCAMETNSDLQSKSKNSAAH